MSGKIYAEYDDVIRRPRFQRADDVIASTLQVVRENAVWVSPTETIRLCADPEDDMFLEGAYAARATYLVTGNLKHFPPACRGIRIVTARDLLNSVSIGPKV